MTLSAQSNLMANYPAHGAICTLANQLATLSLKSKLLAGSNSPDKLESSLKIFEYIADISEHITNLTMAIRFHSDKTPNIVDQALKLSDSVSKFTISLKL